jgi:hypothetical protein
MEQGVAQTHRRLDEAVEELAERAFDFLERLVAEPSVLGRFLAARFGGRQ